jgi:hypothetical protein
MSKLHFLWYSLVLPLAFLMSSCQNDNPPELPLPEEQLVKVLADVHIAEAAGQQLRGETKDSVMQVYYEQICTMHGVNQEDFKTSMELLRNEPGRLHLVYEKVMEQIERIDAQTE